MTYRQPLCSRLLKAAGKSGRKKIKGRTPETGAAAQCLGIEGKMSKGPSGLVWAVGCEIWDFSRGK